MNIFLALKECMPILVYILKLQINERKPNFFLREFDHFRVVIKFKTISSGDLMLSLIFYNFWYINGYNSNLKENQKMIGVSC